MASEEVREPQSMPLDARTLIFDPEENEQLLWIDGVVVLPVGAVVELGEPNRNATVTRVRLLAGVGKATVILDVKVVDVSGSPKARA